MLAVTVMMILLMLGAAILLRSQRALVAAADASDAAAAEAGAEQGVAEAIALLDSGARGDFTGSGSLVDGTYSFTATELTSTTYLIAAEGRVGESARAVEATVGGEAVEEYTLLIDTVGRFNTNRWPIGGLTATNGPLNARNSTSPGDQVDLFGPRARCTGCAATTTFPDVRDIPPPVVPAVGRRCPSNGVFSGVIDGRDGVPFVCSRANVFTSWVTFRNNITITNPPLVVYIRIGRDVRFTSARVNVGGDPSDFQLFAEGNNDYWWMDAWNSEISGLLYGPGRDSWMGNVELTGSLAAGEYEVRPGRNMRITPAPTGSGGGVTGWAVTSWERVGVP